MPQSHIIDAKLEFKDNDLIWDDTNIQNTNEKLKFMN